MAPWTGSGGRIAHSGGDDGPFFQPHTNYRALDFDKPLSTRMVQTPDDLRRTVTTRALESGLTYPQVQMVTKHRDPKTVMRYDHGRENPDHNAVNFLVYD
jgi:integrase